MTYDIHPIIVHFPIALLFIYSIIKILPFKKWFPGIAWGQIEGVLLFIGVAGAFMASSTGEIAEELSNKNKQLIETHSFFAGAATFLYGLLLAGIILPVINDKLISKLRISPLIKLFDFFEKILKKSAFAKFIAFIALIAISITGLLGGAIVYGTKADPLAKIVLNLLGISI